MRMGIRTNGSVKPHASPVYDFAGVGGENPAREFFELCTLAILRRRRWTFVLKWQLPAAMQCDAFRLREIVAASPVGCVVVRYETKDVTSGATVRRLAKFAVPENDDATERFDVETRNLATLKAMRVDVGLRGMGRQGWRKAAGAIGKTGMQSRDEFAVRSVEERPVQRLVPGRGDACAGFA